MRALLSTIIIFYDSRRDYAVAISVAFKVQLSKDRFLSLCYYCLVHSSKIVSMAIATARSRIYQLCIHVLALSEIFVEHLMINYEY